MTLTDMLKKLDPGLPAIRDMTPREIARRYGATVADYIVELRWSDKLWMKMYYEKLEDPPPEDEAQCGTS